MRRGTDRQTDKHTDTQTRVINIHFASATPHAKWSDVRGTDTGERVAAEVDRDAAVARQLRLRYRLRRAGSRQEPGARQGVQSAGNWRLHDAHNTSASDNHAVYHTLDNARAHSVHKR